MTTNLLRPLSAIAALALVTCNGDEKSGKDTTLGQVDSWEETEAVDNDGDGVTQGDGDCDDLNPDVFPGRVEDCNGSDDNCNGVADEGLPDADVDGTADCMDTEDCDTVDNDGDGEIDEGFADSDGDGVPDCLAAEECDGEDDNGDGRVDEGFDSDGDGFTTCGSEDADADCDDADDDVYPGATEESGDLVDNDCNGLIDEGDWESGDLLITEIMANPALVLDPDGEWFEVYNRSGRTVILNGLVLTSSVDSDWHQVASDQVLTLRDGEHFVFGSHAESIENGGVTVDYEYVNPETERIEVSLSNETDDLIIMAGDVIIDERAWDDGATMPDPSGASISLDPWGYSAADDLRYWCAATDAWDSGSDLGSPGGENELCSTFDHDGDNYSGDDGDCDDDNDRVYPGAPELDAGVDNDCDGRINVMPTAVASYDASTSALVQCSPLYLDGSGSSDADGSSLTYTWELTSAPSSSVRTTSDIQSTTDQNPIFYPDVTGDYVFTLTVNDGDDDSFPNSVTVTISDRASNTDPVADAGADQTYSESVTCQAISYGTAYQCDDCGDYDYTLDGSASSDADADNIESYAWSITSGDTSYASIADDTTSAPTVTFTGVPATYGSDTTVAVEVTLTVADCMGATGTDTVSLSYTCTGA